jgi:hypothetical protein
MTNKRQQRTRRELAARIEALIGEAGDPPAFCRRVWPREPYAANKAKVSKWRNSASGMDPAEVVEVARAFSRRPAWLLFGELPELEGITREIAGLEADLAAYVSAELEKRFPPLELHQSYRWEVSGVEALKAAVEAMAADAAYVIGVFTDAEQTSIDLQALQGAVWSMLPTDPATADPATMAHARRLLTLVDRLKERFQGTLSPVRPLGAMLVQRGVAAAPANPSHS